VGMGACGCGCGCACVGVGVGACLGQSHSQRGGYRCVWVWVCGYECVWEGGRVDVGGCD